MSDTNASPSATPTPEEKPAVIEAIAAAASPEVPAPATSHAPGVAVPSPKPQSALDAFLASTLEALVPAQHVAATRAKFIETLVNAQVDENAKTLAAAHTAFLALRKKVGNIRPAPAGFTREGKPIDGHYTKEQTGEIKKGTERLQKGERAFEKALLQGDFADLKQWANEKEAPGKPAADDAA